MCSSGGTLTDSQWWDSRLELWSREGFNVEEFRKQLQTEASLASELFIQFEKIVYRNRNLRRRVIDSHLSNERKGKWLERLDQVDKTDQMVDEWEKNAANERPWEPFVYRAMPNWRERDRSKNLQELTKRLESLDKSSIPATRPLLVLFDDVDSEESISELIADIEIDEARRRKVISEMIDLLSVEGVDGSKALKMDISTALDYLSELQETCDIRRSNRLRIEQEIRPYDSELSDRLLSKEQFEKDEISAIINNFDNRLKEINDSIQRWREIGIVFPHEDRIRKGELLDWEAGLPEIEKAIQIHLRAKERWDDFRALWPDKATDGSFVGHLDRTEEFVDLVDSLDQEWRELELEGMQIIEVWEDRGFVMDIWRQRISEEPRSALKWLHTEEERYTSAAKIVDDLLAMDTSLGGEDEVMSRIAILREYELDEGIIEEMLDFVESKGRRAARHRMMLESDWMDMLRKGSVDDVSTAALSLADFEKLIANSKLKRRDIGVPVERLVEKMREDIDSWHRQGFSIDAVSKILDSDPMTLALRMANIRKAIEEHGILRKRLAALDWRRNPELSIAINLDLARPDRLDYLKNNIPQLAEELANLEVIDSHFKFIPWYPKSIARPILMPASQTNVDDAMEAILEEMETPIEAEEILEETVVSTAPMNIQNEVKEEVILEKEIPIENTLIIQNDDESGSVVASLLREIGLQNEADVFEDDGDISKVRKSLSPYVGIEPRDLRIDRLLRLILRLLPKGDEFDKERLVLLSTMQEYAKAISGWTRKRLEARHKPSTGSLLEDSLSLGDALIRIPGPGSPLPLESDDLQLPSPDDIEGLTKSVNILGKRSMLSTSGGVR